MCSHFSKSIQALHLLYTRAKLLSILHDRHQKHRLMVELAVTIDLGVPFVKMMYNLECDGPLVPTCYETISVLNAAARQAHYPNLTAIASQIASGDSQMEGELIQHAKSCVQSGLTYYFQQLAGNMKELLAAFKAAQLFSPFKVTELNPSNATIDTLSNLPFLSSAIPDLKVEH